MTARRRAAADPSACGCDEGDSRFVAFASRDVEGPVGCARTRRAGHRSKEEILAIRRRVSAREGRRPEPLDLCHGCGRVRPSSVEASSPCVRRTPAPRSSVSCRRPPPVPAMPRTSMRTRGRRSRKFGSGGARYVGCYRARHRSVVAGTRKESSPRKAWQQQVGTAHKRRQWRPRPHPGTRRQPSDEPTSSGSGWLHSEDVVTGPDVADVSGRSADRKQPGEDLSRGAGASRVSRIESLAQAPPWRFR